MKLCFLYNSFDFEYLKENILWHQSHFDLAIVLWQTTSNHGHTLLQSAPILRNVDEQVACRELFKNHDNVIFELYEPSLDKSAQWNEFEKRKRLIEIARMHAASHYLQIDNDEFYEVAHLDQMKELSSQHLSFVSDIETYCRLVTLKLEHPERTQIVGITNINVDIALNYATSFVIDPTRRPTCDLKKLDFKVHHFSHVRSNILDKTRNSTAHGAFTREYFEDYIDAKHGSIFRMYQTKLVDCENIFNLPNRIDPMYGFKI